MSAQFQCERWVYTVVAKLETEIGKFNVVSVAIRLEENMIPTLRVELDPFHEVGDPVDIATAPGPEDFIQRWNTWYAASLKEDTRTATLTLNVTADADKQSVVLTDWIILNAGFTGISARGTFTLAVELAHPFWRFREGTIHLYSSGVQATPKNLGLTGGNLHELMYNCMHEYFNRNGNFSLTQEQRENNPDWMHAVEAYKKMMETFKNNLEWSTELGWSGLPTKPFGNSGQVPRAIAQAMYDYISNISRNAVWDWLAHTMATQWDFTINLLDLQSSKLSMRPFGPYRSFKIQIPPTDISDFDLPPTEGQPTRGVCVDFQGMGTAGITWVANSFGKQVALRDVGAWVEQELPGEVVPVMTPAWVRDITAYMASGTGKQHAPVRGGMLDDMRNVNSEMSWSANKQAAGAGTGLDHSRKEYDELVRGLQGGLGQQYFTENFRRFHQIAIYTRFMLTSADAGTTTKQKYILPGYTARMKVKDSDVDFYVTRVRHMLDCARGMAQTEIVGNYVHPAGIEGIRAIPKGVAPNYLYGA